jgi:hypothetical protein
VNFRTRIPGGYLAIRGRHTQLKTEISKVSPEFPTESAATNDPEGGLAYAINQKIRAAIEEDRSS